MRRNIFFDLDGTLIDSTHRLYYLFQSLVPISTLTYQEYWTMKRKQIVHKGILKNIFNYSDDKVSLFHSQWMKEIEDPKWLEFDKPFEGVTELLEKISKDNDLFLVTSRQHNLPVHEQIKNFKWESFFAHIFITNQRYDKAEAIRNTLNPRKKDWFIGDTGVDIKQGKILGIKTAAVLSGFLNRESLSKYSPDLISENVTSIPFVDLDAFG